MKVMIMGRFFSHVVVTVVVMLFVITDAYSESEKTIPLLFFGNQNLPPMIYLDNDKPKGIVIDLVRALEKKMERPIVIKTMNWAMAQKSVLEGNGDALLQINKTEERLKAYDFSDPLLISRFSIFTLTNNKYIEGISELEDLRVAVEEKGLPALFLSKNPKVTVINTATILDGFYLLKENGADALVVDELVGKYILAMNHINNIAIVGEPIVTSNSSIAVRKGDTELLVAINRGLSKIRKDGTYDKILNKWNPQEGIFQTREHIQLMYFFWGIGILLFIILLICVWTLLTARQLAANKKMERTLELEKQQLSDIIVGTNTGIWEWNVQTGVFTVNDLLAKMIGCLREELEPITVETWRDRIHPEDFTQAKPILENVFSHITEIFAIEIRIRHKSDTWVWLHAKGKVQDWKDDGTPLIVSGTLSDINERKISEEKIKTLLGEKELLLREVHHRIKNNMYSICGLLTLQAATLEDPHAITALKEAGDRVQSMMLLYDRLYRSPDYHAMPVKEYLPSLIDEILSHFPETVPIRVVKDIGEFSLTGAKLQPLGIIVNELLTNCMKYAFSERTSGIITVSATLLEGYVKLIIADNGIGMSEAVSFENSTGFGLTLIRELSRQMEGTIRIERENGTSISFVFPA